MAYIFAGQVSDRRRDGLSGQIARGATLTPESGRGRMNIILESEMQVALQFPVPDPRHGRAGQSLVVTIHQVSISQRVRLTRPECLTRGKR